MRFLHLILIVIILGFLTACESSTPPTNTINSVSPTPEPTVSTEEAEKNKRIHNEEITKPINEFIIKNHKGWQLKGISNELGECEEYSNDPCDLLLSNGKQEKVVSVKIKRFTSNTDESYLVAFPTRSIDLIKPITDDSEK